MLTISEWISFLSSEKHSNTSNVISFGSFILAAGIAVFAVNASTGKGWPTAVSVGILGVALIITYFKTVNPLQHATRVATKLLDDILYGTVTDTAKIEEEWKKVIERKNQRRARRFLVF
jgi:hypothetical protein